MGMATPTPRPMTAPMRMRKRMRRPWRRPWRRGSAPVSRCSRAARARRRPSIAPALLGLSHEDVFERLALRGDGVDAAACGERQLEDLALRFLARHVDDERLADALR